LLNIRFFLLFYAPGQTLEFIQSVGDAMARPVYVRAVNHGCCLSPSTAGATGDCRKHFKIPQQTGGCGFSLRLLFMGCPACFQKQRRLLQDPVPHLRRRVTPGRVQLAGFTAAELV
jgi:hypothetical protein